MAQLRFLHAADLHLDSPFQGLMERATEFPAVVEALREASFRSFERIVQLCIDSKCDFLVVAGDVYDGADRSLRAQREFHAGLARLGEVGIRSYIIHGNHDPLSGWSNSLAMHPLVTVFGRERSEVFHPDADNPMARIIGQSYGEQANHVNPAPAYKRTDKDKLFSIGILHSSVGDAPGHGVYAPCSLRELQETGLDYIALGHIHKHDVLSETPYIVYAGNPQGRSIRETGPRGCYLVEVSSGGNVTAAFREMDSVRWFCEEVSLAGVETITRAEELLSDCLADILQKAADRPVIGRIILTGRTSLNHELRRGSTFTEIQRKLNDDFANRTPFAFLESMRLKTQSLLQIEDREQGDDLLATILQLSKEPKDIHALEAELDSEIDALFRAQSIYKVTSRPDADEWEEIVRKAREMCMDLMEGEETDA